MEYLKSFRRKLLRGIESKRKSLTLNHDYNLEPEIVLFPHYMRIINLVHHSGKKFLLHSCGNIFPLMDDIINLGIDAKHSNEDQIAPFTEWVEKYSQRIGLFGGFDLNLLVLEKPEIVNRTVLKQGTLFRRTAKGYGLGSGNSIPGYIPVDGFLAMIEAVKEIRHWEDYSINR